MYVDEMEAQERKGVFGVVGWWEKEKGGGEARIVH
jgi:hypothetical protein